MQADKGRSERSLAVGEWVYLKIQPYRQVSLAIRSNLKLGAKYYGPYQILERIGEVAYKLLLPQGHCYTLSSMYLSSKGKLVRE